MSVDCPKLRDTTVLACPFPTVQAQEANRGWCGGREIGIACKAMLESSLGELPDQNGPCGAEEGPQVTVRVSQDPGSMRQTVDSL